VLDSGGYLVPCKGLPHDSPGWQERHAEGESLRIRELRPEVRVPGGDKVLRDLMELLERERRVQRSRVKGETPCTVRASGGGSKGGHERGREDEEGDELHYESVSWWTGNGVLSIARCEREGTEKEQKEGLWKHGIGCRRGVYEGLFAKDSRANIVVRHRGC
jgi:hypothetical protein